MYFTASVYFASRKRSPRAILAEYERNAPSLSLPCVARRWRVTREENKKMRCLEFSSSLDCHHGEITNPTIRRGCILENVRVRGVVFSSLFLQQLCDFALASEGARARAASSYHSLESWSMKSKFTRAKESRPSFPSPFLTFFSISLSRARAFIPRGFSSPDDR